MTYNVPSYLNNINKEKRFEILFAKIIQKIPQMPVFSKFFRNDYFLDLDSVSRERIFRFCDIPTQRKIEKAYRGEPAVREFEYYRQKITCFLCTSEVWVNNFWASANENDLRNGGIKSGVHRPEPSFDSDAFRALYKFKEKNEYKDLETYILRDFSSKEDCKVPDALLRKFLTEIESLYKAQSLEELIAHIEFVHIGPGAFSKKFFSIFTDHLGECLINLKHLIKKIMIFISYFTIFHILNYLNYLRVARRTTQKYGT